MNARDLLGVWQLQEFVLQGEASESHPFGKRPKGRLHVSEHGELLVSIFAEGRARFVSDDLQAGLPDEAAAVLRSSLSYFGRWRLNPDAMLRIEVDGALFPNLESTTQERLVAFPSPDELVLTTMPVAWAGRQQRGVLRWIRLV